jgi:hypothetical protein
VKHIRKALFPISLSNSRFSSEWVAPAIASVLSEYNDITIVIADKLQLYNHVGEWVALQFSKPAQEDFSFASQERTVGQTLEERQRWLERLKLQLGLPSLEARWHIYSVANLGDSKGFEILRRIAILYEVDTVFRREVDEWAKMYVDERYRKLSSEIRTKIQRLSVRYILEEAALSLRVRVFKGICDEFYIGSTNRPVASIYWGRYSKNLWELVGLPPKQASFAFHEYVVDANGSPKWRRVDHLDLQPTH